MTLRKVFTLFLCLLLAAYLIAGPYLLYRHRVDYRKSYDYRKQTQSAWNGVITLWDFPRLDTRNGTRFSWIKSKISQFEKKNPGVYIEFRELDWKTGPTTLKAAANTGANPDIAPVGSDFFYTSKGVLEELDEYITPEERSDYLENALDTACYNGKLYGLPWMMNGYTLLLNKGMFEEKGVQLPTDGNWTYEQFTEALKVLTYDTNGKGGPDVYGFTSFIEPGYYNIFGLLMCDGGQLFDPETGKYQFDYPEALSGLKRLCSLKKDLKVTPPSFGTMTENEAWSAFLNGKVAVYTGGSWSVPYLRNLQGNYNIDFSVANFPTGKSDVPLSIKGTTCSYGVFKQTDPAKREKCIEFIKFLTSRDTQNELVNFGYFPVRKSGENLYENDKEMYTIQQSLKFADPLPKLANWEEIDIILQSRIKAAVNGEISPEQALSDAKDQIERHLR